MASRWPHRFAVGRIHQPLDLGLGQVLTRAQVAIGAPPGLTVRFTVAGETSLRCFLGMEIRSSVASHCSNIDHFSTSLSTRQT